MGQVVSWGHTRANRKHLQVRPLQPVVLLPLKAALKPGPGSSRKQASEAAKLFPERFR